MRSPWRPRMHVARIGAGQSSTSTKRFLASRGGYTGSPAVRCVADHTKRAAVMANEGLEAEDQRDTRVPARRELRTAAASSWSMVHGIVPADAGVGDALAVDERLAGPVLAPGDEVALDHHADDRALAARDLARRRRARPPAGARGPCCCCRGCSRSSARRQPAFSSSASAWRTRRRRRSSARGCRRAG